MEKLNIDVRSPQTARLHGEMFGSNTPKRFSMNWTTDVWSNTWEFTYPPLLQGEIARNGTRQLRPIGPLWNPEGSPLAVTTSFTVLTVDAPKAADGGGVGGRIWSKLPSASS